MSADQFEPLRIAVALGDAGGIGPEVVLKAIASELNAGDCRYILVGGETLIRDLDSRLGLKLPLVSEGTAQGRDRILVRELASEADSGKRLPGCPEHARDALAWLKDGAALCLGGAADALVTAPVNKESIIRSGETDFVGQTELLSALAGTERTAMMLLGHDDRGRWLRVALATIHVPIRQVAASLSQEKVERAIDLAAQACRELRLARARVAVCGLNPHAGEGGKIGTEEIEMVIPAVEAARERGLDVEGPLAADTLFHYALRGD